MNGADAVAFFVAGAVAAYALPCALFGGWVILGRIYAWFEDRGWFIECHDRRSYDLEDTDEFGYRDFDKRNNILWANKRGPVFWGHWCRRDLRSGEWVVTRWIGFGNVIGRNMCFYRKRSL